MKFLTSLLFVSLASTLLLTQMFSAVPVNAAAVAQPQGIVPLCNPSLAPSTPYNAGDPPDKIPCGVNKFIELIQNLIKYFSLIVIPLAVLMIGWGGFTIMTAAGSEEKVNSGKKKIITAVVGIIIILVSYLIIQFIFNALGVSSAFRPGGI